MTLWTRFWTTFGFYLGLLLLSLTYPPLVLRWLYLKKDVRKLWPSEYRAFCECYGAPIFQWLTETKGVCVRDALAYLDKLFGPDPDEVDSKHG